MSDDTPEESSKTEDPSAKRLEDAHKRGDVVKSQEVTTWFMLGGTGLVLAAMGPMTADRLSQSLRLLLANADQFHIGSAGFEHFFLGLATAILLVALIPLTVIAAVGIAGNLIQHRPLVSFEPLIPKFSKISPISGAQRLFSREALVNFLKGLAKLTIVGTVMAYVLWPERDRLETMVTMDPAAILPATKDLGLKLMWAVMAAMTAIAVLDYFYQRQRRWNRLRMTVQEMRDEFKQMEGDPQIKGRIRAIRLERARRRMMADVAKATVVVANPTHYAVALSYDKSMPAPRCVAKGIDTLALKIREVAEEHQVPVVENPPLARALYASVEIDETIPAEHFQAVAQVIGFVMRLKQRRGWRP
jgi:flagellar biosynthetic protein FlhB